MPTLALRLPAGTPAATREALARALTQLTVQTLAKRGEVTAVMIEEVAATGWTVGGELLRRPSAWLEICITTGTNSAEQKRRFIAGAHAVLRRQLAADEAFEEASYVIVRELPETDWGYGGVTQAERRQQREAAAPPPLRLLSSAAAVR